jgi:hypothetical protein
MPPQRVQEALAHQRAAAQHDSGPSWTHDLTTATLTVASVEAGKHILSSGTKTGAAAATGAAARGLVAASPEAAATTVTEAAARTVVKGTVAEAATATGPEVVATAAASAATDAAAEAEAAELGGMVLRGAIWLGEECVLVFCR